MGRARYDDATKAEAVALAVEVGKAEAARRLGINAGTIGSWMSRAGVATVAPANLAVANEVRVATMEQRRLALASGLMDDIEKLRTQLFAPTATNQAMVVSDGKDHGSHVEIIEVTQGEPSFRDKQAAITSIAIAVDKVQLLTGAATSRTEHTAGKEAAHAVADELKARRDKKAA